MGKWNEITVPKELTVGNHDMDGGKAAVANTELADLLGYGDRPIIAGSKFNQSFYLENAYNKVKIISFDTNIDENGHLPITIQPCKKPIRDWIKSEILNSETNNVLLFFSCFTGR